MKTINSILIVLLSLFIFSCNSELEEKEESKPEKIEFPMVQFELPSNVDTTIFGKQGTRVFIEKESFQYKDGSSVNGNIVINLKEFYTKSDILLANLSTESDGQLLETGGMLNITATCEGKEIEIKKDKRIVIHFPKKKNNYNKMDLFYPDNSGNDSTVSNWKVEKENLVTTTLKLGSFGWWYPSSNDSTTYDFIPKNYIDTGYYWNPLDFYVESYNFTDETKNEVQNTLNKNNYANFESWNDYGVECEMEITKNGFIKNPRIKTKVGEATKKDILKFLKNLPQLEPGTNKYGQIIERKGLLFIQGGNIIPLYKTREEYIKSFSNKYAEYENKPIKNLQDAELEYYIFSVAKLGWINCDRFYDIEEKTNYFVKTSVDKNTELKMVFKDIQGVLIAKVKEGGYEFENVPLGYKATIFGIKNNGGFFQAAFKEINISKTPLENLAFKETTLKELKEQLEKFN